MWAGKRDLDRAVVVHTVIGMFTAGAHLRVPSMLDLSEPVSSSILATVAVDSGASVTAERFEELVEKG